MPGGSQECCNIIDAVQREEQRWDGAGAAVEVGAHKRRWSRRCFGRAGLLLRHGGGEEHTAWVFGRVWLLHTSLSRVWSRRARAVRAYTDVLRFATSHPHKPTQQCAVGPSSHPFASVSHATRSATPNLASSSLRKASAASSARSSPASSHARASDRSSSRRFDAAFSTSATPPLSPPPPPPLYAPRRAATRRPRPPEARQP